MTTSHNYKLNPDLTDSIFRTYDIRGVADDTLSEDNVYSIGFAIGYTVKATGGNKVIIGRDGRNSGPKLLKALATGIMDSGCDVINVEQVPTPVLYYATHVLETNSGVMLTGSHNPPQDNGIKTVINGKTIYGAEVKGLHKLIAENKLTKADKPGTEQKVDIITSYLERITSDVKLSRPLKIVIDCGNGVGGAVAPELFKALGCEVTELFCEVDGDFPNHQPDPSIVSNLQDLQNKVKEINADVGLAFDGDADRVGLVTDQAEVILPDRTLMYFALDLLTRYKNEPIPYDVKCTRNLDSFIKEHGGKPVMVKTGHSLLKAKMIELNALLAGELSGHIFMKERWYGFDDGLYVATRLLELFSQDQRKVSEIFATIPNSVNTPEIKIALADDKKEAFMEAAAVEAQKIEDANIITIDGLRIEFKDGFGLVRCSNTTPYLTTRFEGDDEASLERIKKVFKDMLLSVDSSLDISF